jgi:hypothetical protein
MTVDSSRPRPGRPVKEGRYLLWYAAIILSFIVVLLVIVYFEGKKSVPQQDTLGFKPRETEEVAPVPLEHVASGQTVYVPAYSHIYARGGRAYLLEITLSIRNTDPSYAITVNAVRYYDTNGKLVKEHLDSPIRLAPLASTEFLVEQQDIGGGSGANFVVQWVAEVDVNEPVIEAIMVGIEGDRSIAFARDGVPLQLHQE